MKKTTLLLLAISLPLLFTGCIDNISETINQGKQATEAFKTINTALTTQGHHTVIVPGYGAPVNGNPSYEAYINEVIDFVRDEDNSVDSLVFTGSYSSLEDTSEAESMNQYFNSKVILNDIQDKGITVIKEECAIVSWQNISNSKDKLIEYGIAPDKVTIFGEISRKDKLESLATYKFNEDQSADSLHYTSVEFVGHDFGASLGTKEEKSAKFAAEIAGAYDTELGNELLNMRITKWSEEFGYDVAKNIVKKGCTEFTGFQ
ncbi:MAG: hypothetical protein Q8P90_02960 [bacterium]|nr:hypothetical protein [bacterium]